MKSLKGFTLLEILLTLALVALGFTALIQAVSAGLFAGGANENELVASALASEKIEEMRSRNYSAIVTEARTAVSSFPAFERETLVSTLSGSLKQVSVNVYWYSKSGELNTGLVTYVSDL